MEKRLIKENPALFLGEYRQDLERVYAIDDKGIRYNIINSNDKFPNECGEALVPYPNDIEWQITNHKTILPE